MKSFNHLDSETTELAAIAASVAGGFRPVLIPILKIYKMRKVNFIKAFMMVTMLLIALSCNSQQQTGKDGNSQDAKVTKYKVTFVELGSVKCIPCQQMQPVMKSIEQKYGTQVKVVFHDVWTEKGAPYAKEYKIEAIPTQVFLDETGKEYFRHVGFFPEEELIKVLQQKGVK